jgi:hypothetical protein
MSIKRYANGRDAPGAASTDEGLVEIKLHRDFVLNEEQQARLRELIGEDGGNNDVSLHLAYVFKNGRLVRDDPHP